MSTDEEKKGDLENLCEELESLRQKHDQVLKENEDIRAQLVQYERNWGYGKKTVGWLGRWFSRTSLRFITGTLVYENGQQLWGVFTTWVRTGRREGLEPAIRDFAASVLAQLLRIGMLAVIPVLLTAITTIAQIFLLHRQNELFARQNQITTQQLAFQSFEQTTKFRELLHQPRSVLPGGGAGLWPPPNQSIISQIEFLGENDPDTIINALEPLLADNEGTVAAGALISLQHILQRQIQLVPPSLISFGTLTGSSPLVPALSDKSGQATVGINNNCLSGRYRLICYSRLNAPTLYARKIGHRIYYDFAYILGRFGYSRSLNLKEVDLRGLQFAGRLSLAVHIEAEPEHYVPSVDFFGAEFTRSIADGLSLAGAKFVSANLQGTSFKHANLEDAELPAAQLEGTDFSGANLRGAFVDESGKIVKVSRDYLLKRSAIVDNETKFE